MANSRWPQCRYSPVPGVCSNATAPSVSSINRILRNRAAERAAAEFARAAGYGLYAAAGPHPYFNSHQHPTTSHHLPAGWPTPGATGHPWMLPPLATGISGAAASALLLPPSLSPGAAAAAAAAASASAAGTSEHALHAADAIARGYLQGERDMQLSLAIATRKLSYFRKKKFPGILWKYPINILSNRLNWFIQINQILKFKLYNRWNENKEWKPKENERQKEFFTIWFFLLLRLFVEQITLTRHSTIESFLYADFLCIISYFL